MNGSDLINNLINELERARDLLSWQDPDESSEEADLIYEIETDLDRYYGLANEINDTLRSIEV